MHIGFVVCPDAALLHDDSHIFTFRLDGACGKVTVSLGDDNAAVIVDGGIGILGTLTDLHSKVSRIGILEGIVGQVGVLNCLPVQLFDLLFRQNAAKETTQIV